MKVIALMSGAANTGKSATGITLGTMMAQRGQRVCVIDLDRQKTSTFYLKSEVDPDEPGQFYIGDVFLRRKRVKQDNGVKREVYLADAIRETEIENLFIVPCHNNISGDALDIARVSGAGHLAQDIQALDGFFDIVILDCPGELNILATAAVAAATDIIFCLAPTIKHADVEDVWNHIDMMQNGGATKATVTAVIPCIINRVTEGLFYQEVLQGILDSDRFKGLVTAQIRKQHFEPQAYGRQSPLPISFPKAEVTDDYRKLLIDLDGRGITTQAA
ncbi:hypothetical protein D5S17_35435 [Pseudonocardiaceae bacterium YIM PH 21723]|nr:hypothetical protein D5S17_35435 [Pseudonocardiaceae bacterium YIM PH 21723]